MNKTKIEWTDRSVNPLRARRKSDGKVGWHCVKWSSGCAHCYSETINKRFGTGLPFSRHSANQVVLFLDERALSAILKVKTSQRIFPCDMTDLFQDGVAIEDVAAVFATFAVANWHIFQTLTKRADRMAEIVGHPDFPALIGRMIDERIRPLIDGKIKGDWGLVSPTANDLQRGRGWPLPNWWAGVSVEDQATADERIPHLLRVPARVRFLSCEPLLESIHLDSMRLDRSTVYNALEGCGVSSRSPCQSVPNVHGNKIDWVIVGGESGPGARPMHPDWARSLRDQFQAAGVPIYMKQMTRKAPIPDDLMIREYPSLTAV